MNFLLDTNTCIYALNNKFPNVQKVLLKKSPSNIAVPSIVVAELYFGAEKSSKKKKVVKALEIFLAQFSIIPFDSKEALHYANIRSTLEKIGQPIGPNDLIIASTAVSKGAVLVTNNEKEFKKVKGLRVENWI